jgi:hypothetical protein
MSTAHPAPADGGPEKGADSLLPKPVSGESIGGNLGQISKSFFHRRSFSRLSMLCDGVGTAI